MGSLFSFTEGLLRSLVLLFLLLILGFFILAWLKDRGGIVGNMASWVSSHAEAQ